MKRPVLSVRADGSRLLRGGCVLAILAVGGAVGLAAGVPPLLERTIEGHDCSFRDHAWWPHPEGSPAPGAALVLEAITCPGLRASQAELTPSGLASVHVRLREPELDILRIRPLLTAQDTEGGGAHENPLSINVSLEEARLRYGTRVLVEDLSGTLTPLALDAEGLEIHEVDDTIRIHLLRSLQQPFFEGTAELFATCGPHLDPLEGSLDLTDLYVRHPLLGGTAPGPLAIRARFDAVMEGTPRIEGTALLDAFTFQWQLRSSPRGLHLVLPSTPLDSLLDPLAPLVPEAEEAHIEGRVQGELTWNAGEPPSLSFSAENLAVEGALPPGIHLVHGPFTYRVTGLDGEPRPRTSGETTPGWTPLSRISPHLIHAVYAAEDARFRQHRGFDPEAIREALRADFEAGAVVRGGSTLTQQLAKNLFLDGEQTLTRKLRELLLALELERRLGKDRILELYLNVVQWGPDIYGAHAACQRYLCKHPSRVNPKEAAFLAALLPNPRHYDRVWYREGRPPTGRLNGILENMVNGGWLTPAEAARWRDEPLRLVPPPAR